MSLDAVQVNKRIGLGQSSFGSQKIGSGNTKTTGLSAQATKNLSGASIANKPSVFSFREQSGYHRVYGQNAVKGKTDLTRRRAAVNAQNQGVRSSYNNYSAGMIYAQPQVQQQHMSTLDKIGIGLQIGMQAFNLGKQIFGGANNGQAIDQGMASLGGGGTQIQMSSAGSQSAISGMQNAQTSGAMTTAVKNAETELSSLEGKTEELKSKTGQDTKKLKEDVKTAEKDKSDKNQSLTNAKNTVTVKSQLKDTKQLELTNAKTSYSKAQADVTSAKSALAEANSLPDDNPNKQVAVAKAKKELSQAQQKENKAKSALDNAQEAFNTAEKDVAEATKKQDEAQKAYDTANQNYQQAQTKLTDAQDAEVKLKENERDIQELKNAITKYTAQADQMKQKENDRLQEIDKKIDKLSQKNERKLGKIDTSDGMNLIERNRSKGVDNRNQEIAQLVAEKQTIIQGQAS